ncbi:MAG: hypothetical protein ACI308_02430 [Muribaculaceae bacterium]
MAPVFAFVALYCITDPFKVMWRKPWLHAEDNLANRSHISTQLLKANAECYNYDSFIFGSSISNYFSAQEWSKHLPQGSKVFHFDASCESFTGILNKMQFIIQQGLKLNNALIIIEDDMFTRHPQDKNILYASDPDLTKQADWWQFQQIHFTAFRQRTFLEKYFFVPEPPGRPLDLVNNEYSNAATDSIIARTPEQYFTADKLSSIKSIYDSTMPLPTMMSQQNIASLTQMADLLKRCGTHYRVIIVPRYMNPTPCCSDIYHITQLFGSENVIDFSNSLALKSNPKNYYDKLSHLLTSVCTSMIHEAYAPQPHLLQ